MEHQVFVYGTLLTGEVNHHLLAGAEYLGAHRTERCFTLVSLGAYPGLISGGRTAVVGEVYRVDGAGLRMLDRLEDYPRLYDRRLIQTRFGRAWAYLYRGSTANRRTLPGGDWRAFSGRRDSVRAAAVRRRRDPKNPDRMRRIRSLDSAREERR